MSLHCMSSLSQRWVDVRSKPILIVVFQCYIAACIICCTRGDSSNAIVQDSTLSQEDSTLEQINLILLENNSTLPQKNSTSPQNDYIFPQTNSTLAQNNSPLPQKSSSIHQNTLTLAQENSTIPQNTSKLPQENSTIPQNTLTLPQENSTIPQNTTTLTQETTTIPQNTSTLPQKSSTILQNNSTLPQENSTIPQNNSTLPQKNSTLPQNTSTLPQKSSTILQNNSTLPQENSTIPQNNSTLPQENSTIPQNNSTSLQKNSTLLEKNSTSSQTNPTLHVNDVKSKAEVRKAVRNISIVGDEFMLDGRPLRIVSGSLHYFQVPASYWRDRLRKLKAAGLNSVSTYVEWSYHEPEERQYQMSGDRDVAQFVRAAAEEGLLVLLRVGPYICAERDLGGFPYWLLSKYPTIKLRTMDTNFIRETKIWMAHLFQYIRPLLYGNGGPIILVQAEDKYGSFSANIHSNDSTYKEELRNIFREHIGDKALVYTVDWSNLNDVRRGAMADALSTTIYEAGIEPDNNAKRIFEDMRSIIPKGPLMNSEFYQGWFTVWGGNYTSRLVEDVSRTLDYFLEYNISVNIHMFAGGTNFEFTSGVIPDPNYLPIITSYDYGAPLNEAGDPTPKYFAIRKIIVKYYPEVKNFSLPTPSPKGAYGRVEVTRQMGLLSPKGRSKLSKRYKDVQGATLPTFEALRQRSGLILYETHILTHIVKNVIKIQNPRDKVFIFVDEKYRGNINREEENRPIAFKSKLGYIKLSLLVEKLGRLHYYNNLNDFKGIEGNVSFNGRVVNGSWTVTGYPLENINITIPTTKQLTVIFGPMLHEGEFTLLEGQKTLDTFLDTTDWGKGYVWINGHNLGRYQPGRGPQITLYVPGIWLRTAPAKNKLQILELEQPADHLMMYFIDYPILNHTDFELKPVGLCKDQDTHVKEVTAVSSVAPHISSATHKGLPMWLSKISEMANAFFARVVVPPYDRMNYF